MSKKIIIIVASIVLVLSLIIGLVLNLSLNPKEKEDIPIDITVEETEDVEKIEDPENINILIAGSDKSGKLADVIMLAKVNIENKNVKIISIPRDTRVKVNGKYMKVNSTLDLAGINGVKQATEYILKTKVDHYILFSTDTFREVIDTLGGVDFNVPQNMQYSDPVQDLNINLKKGYQHLDGEKAEQLVRFRKYPMGDLDRIKVQQDFFKEIITQKLNYSLISKADELTTTFVKNVNTDFKVKDLLPYITFLKSIDNINVDFYTIPGVADYIDGISYYILDEDEISNFLLNTINGINNNQDTIKTSTSLE